jgi:hypothetical protein
MGEPATTEGYIEVPGGRVWYRIFEHSSHLAFVEERASYIRVVEDFLGRVEAGVADEA